MAKKNTPIISTTAVTKQFDYSKDGFTLNFNLRVDTPTALIVFTELLEAATVACKLELKERFNKTI